MTFTRENLTSGLLIVLTTLSGSAMYFYGNVGFNQVMILAQLAILVLLAALNKILCNRFILLIILLNVASLTITMCFHKAFGVSIVFINLLLACLIFNNIGVNKKTFITIHIIAAALWTVIAMMAVKGIYVTVDGDYHSYRLLDVTYHKNTIAVIVIGGMFHWLSILEATGFRRITRNIISIPIIVVCFFKILESGCRSVLFAIVVFFILFICLSRPIEYKYYYIILIVGIAITGVFTIYYVQNVLNLELGDVMGRTTINRLDIWKDAFSLIRQHPIFGSGTDIKMAGLDSAHNTILSILKTVGIVPLISFVLCFGLRLVKSKEGQYQELRRVGQQAILASLLITAFESFYVESFISMMFLILLIPGIDNKSRNIECHSDNEFIR